MLHTIDIVLPLEVSEDAEARRNADVGRFTKPVMTQRDRGWLDLPDSGR
jgi:hypothetical protein